MDPKENLVLLAAALLWMVISAETSQATHLPGCQDKCGDVGIPYPFGTSKGCYFDEYFRITCNTTVSTPPIPYLQSSKAEVLSISLDGHMRILSHAAADCYSKSGAIESRAGSYAVLQAFPFSNARNKFFDVDECKDSNLNKCLKKCHNSNGNYTCSCPKGYHGDGRKDGEGCSADQLLVVKIVVGVGASVIVLVAVSGLLYFGHQKRKLIKLKEKYFQQNGDCIAKEGNVEQVDKVARLVNTCLRVKGEERPTMKEVAMELERLRMTGKHPWTNVESNYEQTVPTR
ncbi:WALL-ASSOCIATED RECEPTOR KINASE-LIKE 21 [Salix koriyanagi]|uniref:WALL-ASSOCIATED RECEPTOR KINASE-LIKE 21 n=1 Tax=Salix koriyanagi TaxID=2511006 RepID=A0A9Q0TCV8_9ROSI|nr:WALL-ASSOCIATED RECEPTOR KINASE-LIKE 21 [Salix koriyanagi]